MFKRFSFSITNLWIISGIIALFALLTVVFFFYGPKPKNDEAELDAFSRELSSLSEFLENRWRNGDIEKLYEKDLLKCNDLIAPSKPIHPQYFECNPYFIRCFFSKKENQTHLDFEYKGMSLDRRGRPIISFTWRGFFNVDIKLKDQCNQVKLEPSLYSAGPKEGSINLWDNLDREVFIDKHYVTNGAVEIWKKSEGIVGQRHLPSLDLSLEKKKEYCNFRGGQLLRSAYFDAATMLPARSENYVYKFPYPWTKSKRLPAESNNNLCDKIYSSECKNIPWLAQGTQAPTWSGIYQAQGSFPESFDNKYAPDLYLKLSSQDLALTSPFHQLGIRVGNSRDYNPEVFFAYNGIVMDENLFIEETKGSAFRCMYYR